MALGRSVKPPAEGFPALDPVADESLKVVTYFDALIRSGVGMEGLLKASAAMTGVPAGVERRGRVTRCDAEGRLAEDPQVTRSSEREGAGFTVWLERDAEPFANDERVVERLAIAVELLEARTGPSHGLDVAIDVSQTLADRTVALARLHVTPASRVRILATTLEVRAPGPVSTILPTRAGMLRATLDTTGSATPSGRTGVGQWIRADHAHESWAGAITAFRLADDRDPVVWAEALGAMLILAQAYDHEHPHVDVTRLAQIDRREWDVLRKLVESESLRSAAAKLGMHHSTVQARAEALTRALGYDVRTAEGRMRFAAASILLRLTPPSDSSD